MQITKTLESNSNYKINISLNKEEYEKMQSKVMQKAQKSFKMDGFRVGHVPMDIMIKHINPAYIATETTERILQQSIDQLIKDNPDIKFIGDIYGLSMGDAKSDDFEISCLVDVYPNTVSQNDNWKKIKMDKIDSEIKKEELDSIYTNLLKQYAEYQTDQTISAENIWVVKANYLGKDEDIIDTQNIYFNQNETKLYPVILEWFGGKNMGDQVVIDYHKDLPPMFVDTHDHAGSIHKISCTVGNIQKMMLPEMNEENIKKFFGNEDIHNETELKETIKKTATINKIEDQLTIVVDKYLEEIKSLSIIIPKTMIDSEYEYRLENIYKQYGSKEKFEKFLDIASEKNPEFDKNTYIQGIKDSAKISLEKYFKLKYVLDNLEINDIQREKGNSAEKALYKHFYPEFVFGEIEEVK